MKTLTAVCVLSLLTTTSHAQFGILPPSSAADSVNVNNIGLNSGSTHWNDSSGLQAYSALGDGNSDRIIPNSPDAHAGMIWENNPSSNLLSALSQMNADGGTIRAIFVGETAGWLDDFGYTYSGNPNANSFTTFKSIQSVGSNPTVQFGQYFDVSLLPGEASKFDFWLNGAGAFGPNPPTGPSIDGGVYTAFHPANGSPGLTQQFLWAQSPLAVNTYMPSINGYSTVGTYLVSAEDWRLDQGADADYSDLRIALQFYDANGQPLGSDIPEPAVSAIALGLMALLGASALRRRLAKSV